MVLPFRRSGCISFMMLFWQFSRCWCTLTIYLSIVQSPRYVLELSGGNLMQLIHNLTQTRCHPTIEIRILPQCIHLASSGIHLFFFHCVVHPLLRLLIAKLCLKTWWGGKGTAWLRYLAKKKRLAVSYTSPLISRNNTTFLPLKPRLKHCLPSV